MVKKHVVNITVQILKLVICAVKLTTCINHGITTKFLKSIQLYVLNLCLFTNGKIEKNEMGGACGGYGGGERCAQGSDWET